jgi:hypothetical protein
MDSWWRGLPARAWTTSLRGGGRTAGKMPAAPWEASSGDRRMAGSAAVAPERSAAGSAPAAGAGAGTGSAPASASSSGTDTVTESGHGHGVSHGPNRLGEPAAGSAPAAEAGAGTGSAPASASRSGTRHGHGCDGFLVAWASSPRMDYQPSGRRPHGGQDARRTMGSIVRRPSDGRHRHGRPGEISGRVSTRGRSGGRDRFSASVSEQLWDRQGHGIRPRSRCQSRTEPPRRTSVSAS